MTAKKLMAMRAEELMDVVQKRGVGWKQCLEILLYDRAHDYEHRLYRFARKWGLGHGDAEEVTYCVILRLFKVKTFDGKRPVWPFLRTIARNELCAYRKRQRQQGVPLDNVPEPTTGAPNQVLREIVDGEVEIEKERDQENKKARMRDGLPYLPERQRKALEGEFSGKTSEEIAQGVAIDFNPNDKKERKKVQNAVANLKKRAHDRLKGQLERENWLGDHRHVIDRISDCLSENQKQVVNLWLAGKSYREIAEAILNAKQEESAEQEEPECQGKPPKKIDEAEVAKKERGVWQLLYEAVGRLQDNFPDET